MMFQRSFALLLAAAFTTSTTQAFQQPQAFLPSNGNAANGKEPTVSVADTTSSDENPGFLGRLFRRNKRVEEDLKAKAEAIKTKATKSLQELEARLDAALEEQTDQLINAIALDFVDLFNGHWDLAIATCQDDTKTMMEGSIEELAEDLIELGVAEASEKTLLKQDLSNSRLKIAQTFDGSDYPLRLKQEVYLSTKCVIELYGKFQFDLLEHRALYSLDELIVLGTKVDLEEIIQEAAQVEAPTEDEQQELMNEIATALEAEADAEAEVSVDVVPDIEDLTH